MRKLLYLIMLLFVSVISYSQDKLCYDGIDKLVAGIQKLECTKLDTGNISLDKQEKYRECYITDSAGTDLVALMTSTKDANGYWTNVNYYFYRNSLIKVETGDWNGKQKLNMVDYYYTKGNCQSFIRSKHVEAQRIYLKRQAHRFLQDWNNRLK